MSPECECRHLLPSPRLPVSIPIHAVILLCQSPPLLAVLPYKTNLLVKPPHVSLNMAHLSTLTCKVPSSVSPSFLSCPYSYHLGCSSSVLRSLDCLPQSPLEDAVLPFDRFQSKFVQVSHITLSLDSLSFLYILFDGSHPSCKSPLWMPYHHFCLRTGGDRSILKIQLSASISPEQSSSVSPHLQSITAFAVRMDIAIRPSICMSFVLCISPDPKVTAILMHTALQGSLSHTTQPSFLAPFPLLTHFFCPCDISFFLPVLSVVSKVVLSLAQENTSWSWCFCRANR